MSANDLKHAIEVLDRLKYLLESGYESDVEFLVGNEMTEIELIKAHKCVLGTIPFFEARFRANRANGLPSNEPIPMIDVKHSAFKAMLKFLYSNDLSGINKTNIADVLATAKKYLLPAFAEKCIDLAFVMMDIENVLVLSKVADLHEEKDLADYCWAFVDQNIKNIITSDQFLMLTQAEIKELFERDTLWGDELVFFNGLDHWAQRQCQDQNIKNPTGEQKRAAMGAALNAIRFPLINIEDFNNQIAVTNILNEDEIAAIILYNSNTTNAEENTRISMPFLDKCRSNPRNNSWNTANWGPQVNISENGLRIKNFSAREICVRAVLPIPTFHLNFSSIAYFEVEILEKNQNRPYGFDLSFGFCDKQFPLEGGKGLGNIKNSIGIFSKIGIMNNGSITKFSNVADECLSIGDVIGIGIAYFPEYLLLKCFATCKGKLLGMVELPARYLYLQLFPAAYLIRGDSIRANFGQHEWHFNPRQLRQQFGKKLVANNKIPFFSIVKAVPSQLIGLATRLGQKIQEVNALQEGFINMDTVAYQIISIIVGLLFFAFFARYLT